MSSRWGRGWSEAGTAGCDIAVKPWRRDDDDRKAIRSWVDSAGTVDGPVVRNIYAGTYFDLADEHDVVTDSDSRRQFDATSNRYVATDCGVVGNVDALKVDVITDPDVVTESAPERHVVAEDAVLADHFTWVEPAVLTELQALRYFTVHALSEADDLHALFGRGCLGQSDHSPLQELGV